MILLIFVLLMALSAALSSRERQLQVLDNGGAKKVIEVLQEAYPQSTRPDDYFKELVRAIEVRKEVEEQGMKAGGEQLLEDAAIGAEARAAAAAAGAEDPKRFVRDALRAAKEWPPFFSLSEAGGYYFDSGKATLRSDFRLSLKDKVIPLLARFIKEYRVDVVEVIGHTDEVPMVGQSNLDALLIDASTGSVGIGELRSTDNAGLAIARAVAVVQILRADPRLKEVAILPLSGAQMIVPVDQVADGSATASDRNRRRIEIRLRRSSRQADANAVRVVK
jgi:outer membrane protein OmpA-like peptidoglycan-associated protein